MTGDELLAQIWRTPEDRDLLRVYADWMLEHGDQTRARYMQLALLDDPTPVQEKQRVALRKKHRGAWLGAARPFVYTWQDSEDTPGFVDEVKCAVTKLAAGFEPLRQLGPRLLVSVNPVTTARDRALLASLPLGELYGLGLFESDLSWVSDRLIDAILPRLAGLRELALFVSPDCFSVACWRRLLDALTTIDELRFSCFGDDAPYLEVLVERARPHLRFVTVPDPGGALRDRLRAAFGDGLRLD